MAILIDLPLIIVGAWILVYGIILLIDWVEKTAKKEQQRKDNQLRERVEKEKQRKTDEFLLELYTKDKTSLASLILCKPAGIEHKDWLKSIEQFQVKYNLTFELKEPKSEPKVHQQNTSTKDLWE